MNKIIKYFEKIVIISLTILMGIVVIASTVELAVSRKVVLLDYQSIDAISIIGIAILIGTITGGYYLLKKSHQHNVN